MPAFMSLDVLVFGFRFNKIPSITTNHFAIVQCAYPFLRTPNVNYKASNFL